MRGGYRAGAGRKKGFAAKNAEEARKYFAKRVAQEIEPLCDGIIQRAKAGDMRATKELFDRAWGRPAQSMAFEGKVPLLIMEEEDDIAVEIVKRS